MKYKILFLSIFILFSCNNDNEKLDAIIKEYQNHEGYNYEDYPLGNFSEEYFKAEKEFAESLLLKLDDIDITNLDENDNISFELLSFVLSDIIAYYDFERFLNPLLSDSGFHSSLVYNVRPMYNYEQVKNYLNKLNAIPQYVDQYLPLLRKGLEKGVSQPLVIFKGYESTYNDHITKDFESNYFYSPFNKLPNDNRPVPYHQDAGGWLLSPTRTVTVWLAIDDTDEDNAPMEFLPGSHNVGPIAWKKTEQKNPVFQGELIGLEKFAK